jgi:hypothetical protein
MTHLQHREVRNVVCVLDSWALAKALDGKRKARRSERRSDEDEGYITLLSKTAVGVPRQGTRITS